MTLREKIASLFIIGFEGTSLSQDDSFYTCLQHEKPGGVILFDHNIVNPIQLKALTKQLRQATNYPLFVSVDYEGGQVARLTQEKGFPKTISAKELMQLTHEQRLTQFHKMAETLSENGFNLDFAPVVDLDLSKNMLREKERTFASSVDNTVSAALDFMKSCQARQVLTCLKHFPGHGSSNGDTHLGFVDVTAAWQKKELQPFVYLLGTAPMIMMAHVVNRQLDDSGQPATLSQQIISDFLKTKLNYRGVVVSDDMQMGAMTTCFSMRDALIQSINAGCDMFIYANQLAEAVTLKTLVDIVVDGVESGLISPFRIEDAFERVQRLRRRIQYRTSLRYEATVEAT